MNRKNSAPAFLDGGGETGALMRAYDWSASPLGVPQTWPQSLRAIVALMLNTRFAMFIAWGPELRFLYNDSYAEILGSKHPAALGSRFEDIWAEIWDEVGPLAAQALAGESIYHRNLPLKMRRKGYEEQTWFTFSYSPVRDDEGEIAGMYCAVSETTAQVLAELSRVKENEHMRSLFEQAPGFIAVFREPNHTFEIANRAYLQLVGHRDLVGKPVREALPEIEGQGFFELLDQVYSTGTPYIGHGVSVRLQREPGGDLQERFVDFVYQPIRNSSGTVIGIFVEGSDVTESVKANVALHESEERLRQMVNAIPHLAWIANADGWIYWYNKQWYEYTGTTLADMQGWGWQSVHRPDFLPEVMSAWSASLASGKPFEMTVPLRAADGTFRNFFTHVVPLRDATGNIVQWFGTNTDVTVLQNAEKAVRESERRLREGLIAARMAVWEWDLATGEMRLSDNAEQVFGRTWHRIGSVWKITHPDDLPAFNAVFQRAIADCGQCEITVRMIRPDNGEIIWVEVKGRVSCDASGAPAFVTGVALDVTQRRRAEEELLLANRRKDEFLAMLAHELRNPLAPISTAAQLLKLTHLDEARMRQTTDIIARQAEHMTELIDDLLDVSRVTRGLVTLNMTTLDFERVLADAVEQARPLIEAKRHRLEMQMPAAPIRVEGDRTRLIQIFTNLINNAAKYTPEEGVISLHAEARQGTVEVKVRDNGIGIAPELLPYVFDLFTQAERSPDRAQGGLGLGLALVKSLVELHGGSVAAHSEGAGKGSEFIVRLPRLIEPEDAGESASADSVAASSGRALRVMVVDDNADAAQLIAMLLETLGHRAVVEHSAESALERARREKPDAMFIDIGLPGMDGYELARRLRSLPEAAGAILIALTGYGQPQDYETSKAAGFDHHLVKPARAAQIAALLGELEQRSP